MTSQSQAIADLEDPADLKRLAVALKKKGDLDGAVAALRKAKHLESSSVDAPATVVPSGRNGETKPKSSSHNEETQETHHEIPGPLNSSQADAQDGTPMDSERNDTGGVTDMTNKDDSVAFTDAEMLDFDMMSEFKQSGMDVPSTKDYQAKVLAYKKIAVKFKQNGDIEKAKEALHRAKQFESVMKRLEECDESEDELNEEDEAWLMKELNQADDSAVFDELLGDDEAFSLDDLEDMDAEMLKVMVDAGIEVPTPDEVIEMSKDKKALAVGLKQAGNLVGAKAALVESKRLQSHADRLKELLDEIAKGGDDDEAGLEDLEKLLSPSEVTKKETEPKTPAVPVKSADELKQDVLKLRSENRIKEATAIFKLYKQALMREAEAEELEKRKKLASSIREEIQAAKEQERMFLFYERFIDSKAGALQLTKWKEYAGKCEEALEMLNTKGSDSVDLTRSDLDSNMLKINNDNVDFVGSASDTTDERLEIGIISLLDVQQNKTYKKLVKEAKKASSNDSIDLQLSIRVDVAIQLPPNELNTEENINLSFVPIRSPPSNSDTLNFDFGPSQYVPLPRGKPTYAKMIQRRLGRKRVQILVYHAPVLEEKRSSWLKGWSSKAPEEEKEPVLLGRVVLELKDFLTKNAIAGDFNLADSGRKALGGFLRLGLQVGAPFDADAATKSTGDSNMAVEIKPFSPLSLAAGVC
uniref:Uncharacterized protein n=2 Tax=Pseudictyota dubia TaxID=2749911 RepID=A0A7R9W3V4_9STRA|mmetsp:Transcript_32228/g.59265  ORF Transcript_32228/g.59265 Transcript_32228/m.59265 type:complete len:698 (+) Transcript_32228:130-2223(+)|eukprot:CAMPEP_0197442234 /NCGR_PEP_ID=MMETSP1175-20131217/8295_1 /TAXON_ID=1003142 /ORGANISM="Triceratium dubium, Strain CCMP147" /LENGTH=697 /DNA_ID=CAMNT_0042972665 /DNA_START=108 /DNA_END=2201 /DNA_ORIENTATION=+